MNQENRLLHIAQKTMRGCFLSAMPWAGMAIIVSADANANANANAAQHDGHTLTRDVFLNVVRDSARDFAFAIEP